MQTVSQAWKDNHQRAVTERAYLEISLDIADPDALLDASASDNGSLEISNAAGTVDGSLKDIPPYASLEQNLWLLDGTRRGYSSGGSTDTGFIGLGISKTDKTFETPFPAVTVQFSRVHHNLIPGVTVTWGAAYGEYADTFTVTVYKGGGEIGKKRVVGNRAVRTLVELDIIHYDRIAVTVEKWCLPGRRARIEEIFIGMNKVYSSANLFRYTHSQSVDPLSTALPKAEIQFSVDNVDNAYNPNNRNGLSKYLMERQEIRVRYGYNLGGATEWIDGGVFYLSEWNASQNGIEATFTARDLLEFLSDLYLEGVYDPEGIRLYAVAEKILVRANLPLADDGGVRWRLDESLKEIKTTAPLPMCPLSECLQLIANAGGCALYQDRKGVLHMEKPPAVKTDYAVTRFNSYRNSESSLSKPLKQVNVLAYQYFQGDTGVELYRGAQTVTGETSITVTYSETARNVTAAVTGGTLTNAVYYANACLLTIEGNGIVEILVTGDTLKSSKTTVAVPSGISGEVITVDNPLITSPERARAVGAWMEAYLKNRMSLSSEWRADPRLDALDRITNENEFYTNTVCMTDVRFSFSGAFRGSGEGRVVEDGVAESRL